MSGGLDQVSLAIGELRQSTSNLAQKMADTNETVSEINDKLDAMIIREHEFRTAMSIGQKIAYFVVAAIGGLFSVVTHWLFPSLGK